MEEILTTRIKTREEEINRLQEDKEAHQRELHVKTQELASLKSSLLKTVDVRKSIDLFALSEDGADITNEDDELEIEQIGFVAVDSGQLMITDPCYIDSEWGREEFEDVRLFRDVETGSILQFGRDFGRFDEAPEGYSASVSDLVTAGRFERLELDTSRRRTFSYAGACYATSVRTVLAN